MPATPDDAGQSGPRDLSVAHDAAQSRFTIDLDGAQAVAEYQRAGREVRFTHTEVPPEFEGQGVGSQLAKGALDWAAGEGLAIVPQCPFIAAYVKRHRQYQEHVPDEWKGLVQR